MIEYTLIRSNRKTISIEIKMSGQIIVRSPRRLSQKSIDDFVVKKSDWINKSLEKIAVSTNASETTEMYSDEEINKMAASFKKVLPERVKYYADIIGVDYGNITIRCQKTRWGSCSSRGNLNFNCLLVNMPQEVIDSVIVHELCHRKEMNHSKAFYGYVLKAYPDYYTWNRWLKENGPRYLKRVKR